MPDGVGLQIKCDGFIVERLWMEPGDTFGAEVDCEDYVIEVEDIGESAESETSEVLDREPVDDAFGALKEARYYWDQPAGPQTVSAVLRARNLLDTALPEGFDDA